VLTKTAEKKVVGKMSFKRRGNHSTDKCMFINEIFWWWWVGEGEEHKSCYNNCDSQYKITPLIKKRIVELIFIYPTNGKICLVSVTLKLSVTLFQCHFIYCFSRLSGTLMLIYINVKICPRKRNIKMQN
jgi:hypothetical protein